MCPAVKYVFNNISLGREKGRKGGEVVKGGRVVGKGEGKKKGETGRYKSVVES